MNSGVCFGHLPWKTVLWLMRRLKVARQLSFDDFPPALPNWPSIARNSSTLSPAVAGHGAVVTVSRTRWPCLTLPSEVRRLTLTRTRTV